MSGSQTFQFAYETSGFSDDYNHWQTKTTETLPDGNLNIVYCNYAGQPMLKILQSGSDQWIEFWRYDANAKVILHAKPSAITGYSDSFADLLNYNSGTGTFEYLASGAGLIGTYTYHVPSGFTASYELQHGQSGTSIPQSSFTYCKSGIDCGCSGTSGSSSSSSGTDNGSWFLSTKTTFPSDTDPTRTMISSHCYAFYPGTSGVQQHIVTLPAVSTDQNGSGVAATSREYFDTYGNLT